MSTKSNAAEAATGAAGGRPRRLSVLSIADKPVASKTNRAASGQSVLKSELALASSAASASDPLLPVHSRLDAVEGDSLSGDGAHHFSGSHAPILSSGHALNFDNPEGIAVRTASPDGSIQDGSNANVFPVGSNHVPFDSHRAAPEDSHASPIVQVFASHVRRQQAELDEATRSFEQDPPPNLDIDQDQLGGDQNNDGLAPKLATARNILALQRRLALAERQLTEARAVEPERSKSRSRSKLLSVQAPSVTHGPLDYYFKRSGKGQEARARQVDREDLCHQPIIPIIQQVSRTEYGRFSRQFDAKQIDQEERAALRYSHDVGPEDRSEDSQPGRLVDKNGFERDSFCGSDNEDSLLSSEEGSTDDNTCTTASEANSSTDDEDEANYRVEIATQALKRSTSKSNSAKGLHLSVSGVKLAELREEDVRIKRRTRRAHIVELILNNWLRSNPSNLKIDHVAEFLRQLKLLNLEFAISVYYAMSKRIRPVSISMFKMLYRCISMYLPKHRASFGKAYRHVMDKEKKSVSLSNPVQQTTPSKPTLRAPQIQDITDIAFVVGKFYSDYRAYEREFIAARRTYKSMFQCLSPDQQTTFSAMTMKDEMELNSMDNGKLLELWKVNFGLKSSAAVLAALSDLQFKGDAMLPASWADWFRRFTLTIDQAPKHVLPSEKSLARRFILACPNTFLRDDIVSCEMPSPTAVLTMVISRLNDSGFLRSAASQSDRRLQLAARPIEVRTQERRASCNDPPPVVQQRRPDGDRRDGIMSPSLSRVAQHADASSRQHSQPLHQRQSKPTTTVICGRCKKSGHTESACISKHDVQGNKLDRQDPEVYAKRKEQAVKNATAKEVRVNAIEVESSETEDLEEHEDILTSFEDQATLDEFIEDGVYGVYPVDDERTFPLPLIQFAPVVPAIVAHVPAPPLILSGDVELNPGPHSPKIWASYPVLPSRRPFEREAIGYGARPTLFSSLLLYVTVIFALFSFAKWCMGYRRYQCSMTAWYFVFAREIKVQTKSTDRFQVQSYFVFNFASIGTMLLQWMLSAILILVFQQIPPAPRLVGIEPNPGPAPPQLEKISSRKCLMCFCDIPVTVSFLNHRCVFNASEGHLASSPLSQASQISTTLAGGVPPHPGRGQRRSPLGRGPNAIPMKSPLHALGTRQANFSSIVSSSMSMSSILSPPSDFVYPFVSVAERSIFGAAPSTRKHKPTGSVNRKLSAPYRAPAPSLLRCGDVEANPGPFTIPKDMPALVSDSDTSDSEVDAAHAIVLPRSRNHSVTPPSSTTPPTVGRRRIRPIAPSAFMPAHAVPATSGPTAHTDVQRPSCVQTTSETSSVATAFSTASLPSSEKVTPTESRAPSIGTTQSGDSRMSSSPPPIDETCGNISDENFQANSFNLVLQYSSESSDTSDLDLPSVPIVAATTPSEPPPLLSPPKFIGYLVASDTAMPPPLECAQECAVDTMCQGEFSVISKALVIRLNLPITPFNRQSKTANGAIVKCSWMAVFAVAIFVRGSWLSLPVKALVWENAAEPILLSNSFALDTGIIDFVRPNSERVPLFGAAVFSRNHEREIREHEQKVLQIYHEDVIAEEFDDVIDLAAPTRMGDQDISTLPPDALMYAKRFPAMTKAIPRDAHPALPKWRANVREEKIPLYSWPVCDLKDLKEDKLPFRVVPQPYTRG
jgi:hypothetical protein